jgi:hypothetical protein
MVVPASSLSSCHEAFVGKAGTAGCGAFGAAALSAAVAVATGVEACSLAAFWTFASAVGAAACAGVAVAAGVSATLAACEAALGSRGAGTAVALPFEALFVPRPPCGGAWIVTPLNVVAPPTIVVPLTVVAPVSVPVSEGGVADVPPVVTVGAAAVAVWLAGLGVMLKDVSTSVEVAAAAVLCGWAAGCNCATGG